MAVAVHTRDLEMNFFGVEISDAQFEAGMAAVRAWDGSGSPPSDRLDALVREALGFETGDVAAPPAESDSRKIIVSKTDINHAS